MIDKKIALKILIEIKKANKILLALHVSPDPDSISSTLAMDLFLRRLGKKTKIISYSQIPKKIAVFQGLERIEMFDFARVNFSEFDLFIALDAAQDRMITRSAYPKKFPKNFKIINIDHHITNTKFGNINLVENVSSTAEILYNLFNIWKVKIDKKIAKLLFYGIFTDSGCFQYFAYISRETFLAAADLLQKRASLKEAVINDFRSYSLCTLKYWGKILEKIQMDPSGKFVWSTISKEEQEELGVDPSEIVAASSLFAPIVARTEFGIILTEETNGFVRGSLRSRQDFDVAKIAVELGGGGHRVAAGFSLELPLREAEKKVLETARKFLEIKN